MERIAFAHFPVPALMRAPNASGVPATNSLPSLFDRRFIAGAC